MPFTDRSGIRIHYEVEGTPDGPPIILVHGRGWSVKDWYRSRYPELLGDEFRVLLIDCRGFGESDKPHDPEVYGQEQYMDDLCAVLDDQDIPSAHYWGYSMGGKLGWAMAIYRPDRVRSVTVGEYPALGKAPSDEDRYRWEAQAKLLAAGMDMYVAGLEMTQGRLPEYRRGRLLAQDPIAYSCQQLGNFYWGATEEQVRAITTPMFIYTGADRVEGSFSNVERTKRSAGMVSTARYTQFDVQGHEPTFEASDLVVPHVKPFLWEVEQALAASA